MKTLPMTFALALTVVLLATPASAGWFELGLSSDSAQISAGAHLGDDPDAQLALGGRGLFYDDADTKLGAFVCRFEGAASAVTGFRFGIGVDVFLGESWNRDVGAAVVGFEGSFAPESWRGGFVGGRLGFAPGFMTWSDTERFFEWSVRGGYRFNPKIGVFLEYQRIEADFDDLDNRDLDDSVRLGFGGRF